MTKNIKRLILISIFIIAGLGVSEIPFWFHHFEVTHAYGSYFLSTHDYIRNVPTLTDDIGYIVSRDNGIWEPEQKRWTINCNADSLNQLREIFSQLSPLIEEAFPEEDLSIGIWLTSKRVVIMFDKSTKVFYEEAVKKINKLL